MSERKKKVRESLRLLGSLVGVGFLIFQIVLSVTAFNWSTLSSRVLFAVVIAFFMAVSANALQMIAWKVLLGALGHHISSLDVLSGYSVSFVARYIPGTVWGYLSRGDWLKREHQVDYATSNLGALIEVFGIVLSNIFVVLVPLLFFMDSPSPAVLSIVIFLLLLIGGWAFLNFAFNLKVLRKFVLKESLLKFPFFQWTLLFSLFVGMWFCFGFGLYVLAISFGLSGPVVTVFNVSAVYALAWLIGFAVLFVPSGLGLREYSITFLLSILLNGVSAAASVVSVGFRLIVLLAEMFWILVGFLKKQINRPNRLSLEK